MRSRSHVAWLAAVLVAALSLSMYAQDQSTGEATTASSDSTLNRSVLVPLKTVKQLFPDITHIDASGANFSAAGTPVATRVAIYATRDGSRKVTLSVDEYQNAGDALSAYQVAFKKSQSPEFAPIAISNVGENVFAGTVTQGSDTHVTIGALDGILIVGATMSGFDATTENIASLSDLARKEVEEANTHVKARRRR